MFLLVGRKWASPTSFPSGGIDGGEWAHPSALHSVGWLKIHLLVVWLDWRLTGSCFHCGLSCTIPWRASALTDGLRNPRSRSSYVADLVVVHGELLDHQCQLFSYSFHLWWCLGCSMLLPLSGSRCHGMRPHFNSEFTAGGVIT